MRAQDFQLTLMHMHLHKVSMQGYITQDRDEAVIDLIENQIV